MKANFKNYINIILKEHFPLYLISGSEPFQKEQVYQQIITNIKKSDIEIIKITIEQKISQEYFYQQVLNMSLFNKQRCFVIRFSKLPDASTQKLLLEYFSNNKLNDIFIIDLPQLSNKQTKQKWYIQLEKIGLHISVWQPNFNESVNIIKTELKNKNIKIDYDALLFLTQRTEGNLLAASQFIKKFSLIMTSDQNISMDIVKEISHNASNYDVFDLCEQALIGDLQKIHLILARLKQEGVEDAIILWAITKEARTLIKLKSCKNRTNQQKFFSTNKIWQARQHAYLKANYRLNIQQLYSIIKNAYQIDLIIKGAKRGDIWHEFSKICSKMIG